MTRMVEMEEEVEEEKVRRRRRHLRGRDIEIGGGGMKPPPRRLDLAFEEDFSRRPQGPRLPFPQAAPQLFPDAPKYRFLAFDDVVGQEAEDLSRFVRVHGHDHIQ
jgi:hypothetical protein